MAQRIDWALLAVMAHLLSGMRAPDWRPSPPPRPFSGLFGLLLFSGTEPEKPRAVPSGSGNFAGDFRKAIVEAAFEGKAVIEHCDAVRFFFPHANQYRSGFNSSTQRNVTAAFIRQGDLVEL